LCSTCSRLLALQHAAVATVALQHTQLCASLFVRRLQHAVYGSATRSGIRSAAAVCGGCNKLLALHQLQNAPESQSAASITAA